MLSNSSSIAIILYLCYNKYRKPPLPARGLGSIGSEGEPNARAHRNQRSARSDCRGSSVRRCRARLGWQSVGASAQPLSAGLRVAHCSRLSCPLQQLHGGCGGFPSLDLGATVVRASRVPRPNDELVGPLSIYTPRISCTLRPIASDGSSTTALPSAAAIISSFIQ